VLDILTSSALLASGGGLAPVTSTLVRPLLEDGRFDQHLARLKDILEGRLTTLAHSLQEQLGDRLELSVPSGGYFIWAKWVSGVDTTELLPKAHQAGTGYQPGGYFSDSPGPASAMRLCFAYYDESQLTEACARLGRL
jgi:DNA-binding transcriptional MocR family regulator